MKQKTSGLHVGKYRKHPDFKTNLAVMLLPAALIFCALVGLLTTVTGLTAILPLFASSLIFLALFTLAKHFRKEAILLPAALVILIIIVCCARSLLLNGFAALWNETRGLWAAENGILLSLAETDGSGLWLASILLGIFLAALSLALSKAPTLAAALLILLTVATGLVHVTPWLLLSAGVSVLFLALQCKSSPASAACLAALLLAGFAGAALRRSQPLQNAARSGQTLLHRSRYEIAANPLPEGRISQKLPENAGEKVLISVTSDHSDLLYLRGFVGDVYENGDWSPLSSRFVSESRDLFYWLHENGFYPQTQFALSAVQTTEYEAETIQIQNLSACSLYRYEPFSVVPTSAGTVKNRLAPSAVKTSGWSGEREYSYTVIADASSILPQILDDLQQNEANGAYLQLESAYRDFVDSYALAVPQEFTDEMGSLLEETKQNLNFSGALTKEEAQLCALSFLETCFDGNPSLPLDSTAKGTTYQYATVAALALRYYGIPARYVEGFTVKTQKNSNISVTNENAGAWVEVYQDGVGWLPLALTPGLESLAPEQAESGIKPVGTGENGTNSGPRITEGQEPEEQDADQSETPDNTPDGGQRTGLLATPAFWLLLVVGVLFLFILFILIRHHILLKKRRKMFENENNSESVSSLFSDAAKLLSALGFDRRGDSMLALYDPISGQFGEETANTFRTMVFLNEKALFSSKTPDDPEREAMQDFHKTVLNLLKTNTKWPRKLRLKWLNCLY